MLYAQDLAACDCIETFSMRSLVEPEAFLLQRARTEAESDDYESDDEVATKVKAAVKRKQRKSSKEDKKEMASGRLYCLLAKEVPVSK